MDSIIDWWTKVKISQSAILIGEIFNEEDDGMAFLDLTLARFEQFDESNRVEKDKTFSDDINYILQFAMTSLTSKISDKVENRIDSYFYIYRRLKEYHAMKKKSVWSGESFTSNLEIFRKKFYEIITNIFVSSQGTKPNLCSDDEDLLKRMNILQHLSLIKTIDTETLNLFFVLCKLSMQSSLVLGRLKWIDILLKTESIKIPLHDFINQYAEYAKAFEKFPLDTSTYIYLIQKIHPLKQNSRSPFDIFISLIKTLNLNADEFFDLFQPVFIKGLKDKRYEIEHISKLFKILTVKDHLFCKYISIYSSNVHIDDLWNMFIHLCIISDINDIIKKYLTPILIKRISTVSIETFSRYAKSVEESLTKIKPEFHSCFIEIFEKLYDALITTQIQDPKYSYRITKTDLKDLLKIGLSLTSTNSIKRPSCSILFRELLFKIDIRVKNTAEKLKYLFQNFYNFDDDLYKNHNPIEIIDDEWLKEFLINNSQIWLKLDHDTYKYLTTHHQNNPWIIHIWTKIIHLSLLKLINENPYDTLLKLNEWMKNVKHNIYHPTDILTIIFVTKIFELIIIKHIQSISSLPNIEIIMNFIFSIRKNQKHKIDIVQVDLMIENAKGILQDILQLKGTYLMYRELLKGSILYYFLPFIDIKKILTTTNPEYYKFSLIASNIDSIISLPKPKDIDIENFESNQEFFIQFIQQINQWFQWFNRFIDIFQYIIEWLKNHNVIRANQYFNDLHTIRTDSKITLIHTKTLIENILKLLQPIVDLRRLCHLFNCLTSFQIIDFGKLNTQDNTIKYIAELKRFQPNNTFTIEHRSKSEQIISIPDRQQVQWSLASENSSCDIQIKYQTNDHQEILFEKENISIHKHVLYGQFESQKSGQLIIMINNKQYNNSCRIWYRIKLIGLSTCHLFQGIFNIFYEKYSNEKFIILREDELSQLLNQVFLFIDKLLNGSLSLRDMNDLRNIFCDKNIHIKEEVKKLYTNRTIEHKIELNQSNEKEIEQVCEWLQIYQYYSHINIIMECIEKFDILQIDNEDNIIGDLRRLSGNENCSLREITDAYKILQQSFQNLTNQHLQLIKTAIECSNVIHMMKKSDLYSNHGRRRFRELQDNLTTQFQLQERNNMILNSWIMTYALIEPFIFKAKNFDDFVSRLAQLSNLEESSLNHIKIVNDNMQIVNMWLSAEETTVLDNALITMEHLYKSGTVDIYLRHLMNEESYFEIGYSIDRIQGQTLNNKENEENRRESEKIKFTLSIADIDDHKRQLTFCNVDVEQNLFYKKALINGQLKLLQTVEKIYSILIKLELSGHPDYQLRQEHYEIHLQNSQNNSILSDLRNHQNIRLENSIKIRTDNLQLLSNTLQTSYDIWIQNLEKYRNDCSILKLFSNRQIMFLIILLRTSKIRNRFLKKLFSFKDLNNQNDEEQKLTIQCLIYYLRSLRINQCDLSYNNILNLYTTYQIDSGSNTDLCLKKLSLFLKDLFHNEQDLFRENNTENDNLQYLVTLNPIQRTNDKIAFEHDFDMDTCCILLNIFNNRLPSAYQILWCSNVTDEDIYLFFSRIRTFRYLTFVIMDIDRMHHRLRELLLNQQDLLTRQQGEHGTVYYFSRELTTSRKGLRKFEILAKYRNPNQTYTQLMTLFRKQQSILPEIQIIYGAAGIGKTHRINTQCKDQNVSCFSINDKLNLSLLISSFLLFDSNSINENPTIYFNISIHAPFEALNRTLFSLFICGSLNDNKSGLTFSLPIRKPWKFIIEIPYSDITHLKIKENFDQILPLLSIISPSSLEEVTSDNYQLYIGEEEELVARFLKAFENRTIDRLSITLKNGIDEEVKFDPLTNLDECRSHIYNCINKYAPELPRNKIYELSFTKFLYRRIRFFIGHYYRFNQTIKQLGSIAMRQMIDEAKSLSQINFQNNNYPRIYLVYDPYFSLHLLHSDWNHVSNDLKSLFDNYDPLQSIEYQNKDYFAECLAWLIDIRYETFLKVVNETKFILTENFAYKLFHVHERKLTKLALIIEGDTGVGKTFLLKFYSLLLNSKNTKNSNENNVKPRFIENSSLFLLKIIIDVIEKQDNLLNIFLLQIKPIILSLENDHEDDDNINHLPIVKQQEGTPIDKELLKQIKLSLQSGKYNKKILYHIWKTILIVSNENAMNTTPTLIQSLHDYVTTELANYPLIEGSFRLKHLLQEICSPTTDISIEIFKEYLFHSQIKPLFYRLLLHPGITEEQLVEFMFPISQLARELPNIEIVVFFDEVNTSSCLGLFKEMFMDGTLHGTNIPKNIFFTAAINPLIKLEDNQQVHRSDYLVHELPQSLKHLKVSYGSLESKSLSDYIIRKIIMFQVHSSINHGKSMPLESYFQDTLAASILKAQEFCEEHLGRNSVSQREIQRCFNLIEFFWNMRYDEEIENNHKSYNPNPTRCIALSIALIYYFRLPTKEDNLQRNDYKTPSREHLAELLSQTIPNFEQLIQDELERFVNTDNFFIPQGVAINQAVREHIFSIVVSIVTRTPLCIIGVPGQSKTLSFQIVLQNLQGSQLSPKKFCKRLPAIDPFFCLGSKYSRSEDIAYIFERAIKREQQYEQNRMNTRCVVFLDEASLPDEKKMVLKVLHPYLDECKVAFVAVANKSFDAANANRMICIYRSLPSKDDQKILAYGCLGLQTKQGQRIIDDHLERIIYGLCQGYRRILHSNEIPHIFHDRDFIYMLRELRFELANINEHQETSIGEITPRSLFRALEDNFNGIKHDEFEKLIDTFFIAVNEQCLNFRLSLKEKQQVQRNIPTILRESMKLDPIRRRLYGRYKLIIDESEDESAVHLLSQTGILDSDPNRTTIFRMPDFPDDIDDELRNVEILSTIKLCMETGKTILMVNTGRIHGSLYDVFNQNFSIMATDETRKIFSKVAIGPKTIDVVVHEDFQCIVHIKRSEFKDIPAPFLSRFQKYSFSITDFYSIHLKQLPINEQILMKSVEEKVLSFIQHFGQQYFYGLNDSTLYSCLLTLIKKDENGQYFLSNIHHNYSQLTIKSKSFIEQNSNDIRQCFSFLIISKLLQIVSPESIIYKLPTFEEKIGQLLRNNYFYQQEHFNIENFIQRLISTPSIEVDNNDLFTIEDDLKQKSNDIFITTKIMLFTRTSSVVVGLNKQSKNDLFNNNNNNIDDEYMNISEKIDVLNLAIIEKSITLQEEFQKYEQDKNKKVLIIIIDGRISQQCLHIPFVRQLIDKTDNSCNMPNETPEKFFIILVHSSGQELNSKSCFPSIFLHNWDYYYLDTCTPGSAFHLQKMLQLFTSSFGKQENENEKQSLDNILCDFNILFEDCLWDFCSRLQISIHRLPKEMFKNKYAYEFYQYETSTIRRVQCLKELLQQSTQLQKRIVKNYHDNDSKNKDLLQKNCHLIYQISKDILCGKRFTSLVDSLQSEIRISFTNFVSNFFKCIVNDYGLETLSKLSTTRNIYDSLLNLIDYSVFSTDSNDHIQSNFTLRFNYFFIPQTPLYNLFHERIKSLADEIKSSLNQYTDLDDLRRDYYAEPPAIIFNIDEVVDNTSEQFRNELIKSLMNDKILMKIISQTILESYTNDSIQKLCTTIGTNFNNNNHQCQKTIDFISKWLLTLDDNEKDLFNLSSNQSIWLLAHVYTSIEYDQNDIFSLYSACRIIECLDKTESFYIDLFHNDEITRSKIRENLFRLMFDNLWKKLVNLCSTNDNIEQWIYSYTFISKYYPSEKVLQRLQLIQVKGQIEFMNLSYLIFLNQITPEPKELIFKLLQDTSLIQGMNYDRSICLQLLPIIIKSIHQYFENKNINNSTLLIDIQQWIISTLKNSNQSCREEIIYLFKFLNQSTCQLPLPMKQFLFDELANMYFESIKQNRIKQNTDFWDRICLLSIIIECLSDVNLENYQIPYHPLLITNNNQNQTLIDLFFFYFQRLVNDEIIQCGLINKILLSSLPKIDNPRLISTAEIIFKQFKDYFVLQTTALLLCQSDLNHHDQHRLDRIIITVIGQYLSIDKQLEQLNKYIELFLSIIIRKRSWNFLLNLLKSERFQRLNNQWANTLYNLFDINYQSNKSLQLCHQLQFTLTTNTKLSIFPKFHQPYEELSELIDQCIKNNNQQQHWKLLSDWIQLKLNSNPLIINSTEIKVMLLLNIYYNYYCNNQLKSLDNLLIIIENILQPLPEELHVFRMFLQPEQYMIGYNTDDNCVNQLFKLDCKDHHELNIRHSLVNLLAMILLSGKQNFLWTFTFEPSKLQNTLGFGSTRHEMIQTSGVHYDCGCLLTENGDLIQFPSTKGSASALNIPAVYVAFFSTFGALTWHLLLFDTSVQNLYGPILAKHAIDCTTVTGRIVGDSIRAKVCHFVRARLLSTYHFLSIHLNEDDACILLNRCFEQMAQLTNQENLWIKPIYTKFEEKFHAEQEYQNKIFYPIHQQLVEYKKIINNLYLHSKIQRKLQDYVLQMPISIQFIHFKTELCNPKHSQLSLNILRNILDSFDFLKITHFIYDLSQFYLLLHRTYGQLITREEFSVITLKELYERSEKQLKNSNRFRYSNQNNKNLLIIQNGIKAVNAYHQFADGLIRPGACDETQRFTTISMDTPIDYLLTTENYDEGDIIMRILSVLVDYHNSLLDLLEMEIEENIENNGINLLKNLINELTSKEVSLLQIAQDNTGVITLTDNDCLRIEQLSRASLQTDEDYFPKLETEINFNFLYVQSYIIRSYLLLCRINYRHISQKYQWYISRKVNMTTEDDNNDFNEFSDLHLEDEWNYLKEMNLDKLYNGYNLLRRIIDLTKTSIDDLSKENLYEYLQKLDNQNNFIQQFQQSEIKNFPLIDINYICHLYEKSINQFQHSFINISHLLRIEIDTNLNEQLNQIFDQAFNLSDDNQDKRKLQYTIDRITGFLDDLKNAEDSLLNRSSKSLKQTCKDLRMENSILELIPIDIKCQNYVPLAIKLIEIRSNLQEKTINIEEQDTNLWNINFDQQSSEQQTIFQLFKIPNLDLTQDQPELLDLSFSGYETVPNQNIDINLMTNLIDFIDPIIPDKSSPQPIISSRKLDYTSLFELKIKSIPLATSNLFNQILKQTMLSAMSMKTLRFTIKHFNGAIVSCLCSIEKLYEELKENFEEKKYDYDKFGIIDQNYLFVDFINKNNNTSIPYISSEYRIIEKTLLISIILEFQEKQFEYLVTKECLISSIINRFIIDYELKFTSTDIFPSFFDELGKCIEEDSSINHIYRLNNSNIIRIKIIECQNNINSLFEVTLHSKKDEQQINLFDPITRWQQITLWLKNQNNLTDIPIDTSHFWDRTHGNILDKHQLISSTLDNLTSITIDGINEESIMDIILSYDKKHENIRILKSCPVNYLLNNSQYLEKLNLKISPNDCILVLIEESNKKILNNEDIQQPIGYYSSIKNPIIHFQISILIQLIQFDNEEELQIPISNQNLTINELLNLTKIEHIYPYLALIDTHMILSNNNEKILNINQTKFYLVKENQTSLISIQQTKNILVELDDNTISQRYIIHTTIADIYKQNKSIIQDQYLVYENDFIPSDQILLNSFLQTTSTIQFTLINQKFQANITVINEEKEKSSVQFYCSPSILIERVCQIACQLLNIDKRFYHLILMDNTSIGDDCSLDDIGESIDDIRLKLESRADVKCQIIYEDKMILIPANNETLASTILKEVLEKLFIPNENIHMYKLNILYEPECPTKIGLELSIENIRSYFRKDLLIIPFQLQKK